MDRKADARIGEGGRSRSVRIRVERDSVQDGAMLVGALALAAAAGRVGRIPRQLLRLAHIESTSFFFSPSPCFTKLGERSRPLEVYPLPFPQRTPCSCQ